MIVSGSHDTVLVALSLLVSAAASYTALDLSARVRASRGYARHAWLLAAAAAMGAGIWSMHFIAMLAFRMPMAMSYDGGITALSLLLAMVFTGAGFAIANRPHAGLATLAVSGLVMGLGITAMHYTGMAAMRMAAHVDYEPVLLSASVAIAVGASAVGLWIASRHTGIAEKLAASVAMGLAVAGMHYTAMAAAIFTAHPDVGEAAIGPADIGQTSLAAATAAITFLILFFALLAAMFDRRFAVLAERETMLLRDSEARFRNLYRRTPLPLCSLAADGRIEQVSDSWLDLLGYPRAEVIGRPFAQFMAGDAEGPPGESWLSALSSVDRHHGECRLRNAAGEFVHTEISVRAQRDEAGRFKRALCGLVDVTARKQTELALRQAQKVELLGQLTGGVAHDFNNVLAIVLSSLEPLRKWLGPDARSAKLLDNAIEGARRGKALTERMLSFARRQELNPTAVNLNELVWSMAELLRRSIGPGVEIETRFPLDLPPVRTDANQLELALANLAINGRDAMPDGGRIKIGARRQTVPAGDDALPAGDYVCLFVKDEGVGMDAATLARATEPFFTTKEAGSGTGLGLSMVQGLAVQSGGRFVLRSTKGEGTTAQIWLPVAAPGEGAGAAQQVAAAKGVRDDGPGPGPLKVLLVDDDALVLMGTAAMVEDLGHTVVTAGSGKEALALLEAHRDLDLLVTDQAMPSMNGVQLAAAVRAIRPGLPVILASGYADLTSDQVGGVARLTKPFDLHDLSAAISAAAPRREAPGKVVRLHVS